MPSAESTRFNRSAWWWTITLGVSTISTPCASSGFGSRPKRFAIARRVIGTVGVVGRFDAGARRTDPPEPTDVRRAGLGRADAGFCGSDMLASLGCGSAGRAPDCRAGPERWRAAAGGVSGEADGGTPVLRQ